MTTQNLLLNSDFQGSSGGIGGGYWGGGSFYLKAANWTSTGYSGVLDAGWMANAWGINFPHTQAAVLQAYQGVGSSISQNFSLSESSTLNLNFDYFQRNGGSGQYQEVRVLITNSTDQSVVFDQSTSAIGSNNAANFATAILNAGSYTITFKTAYTQVLDQSVFIDNINLTATSAVVNHAPTGTATALLAAGTEDTAYTISTANLLTGFSDVDGDTLSVTGLTATNGTLTPSGSDWTFTPNANFNGTVALTYNVVDGHNGSVSASNSFNLMAVNDEATISGNSTGSVTEDSAAIAFGSLIVSDVDTGEDRFAVVDAQALNGAYGSFTFDNGAWTYTQDQRAQTLGDNVTKTETLTVSSLDGAASQVISVDIRGVNDAPALTATAATLAAGTEDTAYTILTSDLLTGFSDIDGDTLSVTGLTATNGTLTPSGSDWTFTPNANFNGTVALTYNVVDGHNGSVSASNSFNLAAVNDAPVASAVTLTQTSKEDEFVIKKADLLANVTDADSTTLSISSLTLLNPTQGELEALKDGSGWEFSVEGHKSSVVNFSYTVTDGLASSQGSVTLTLATKNSSSNQNQKIIGKDAAETLIGGNGDDIINGKNGNDSINGGNGKDILFGGKGSDTLTGGNGPDTFVFAKQSGNDTITDFAVANDKILLVGEYKWASVQQSYANGTDIVTVGTGSEAFTITLTGVPGKLEQNSFTFAKDMPDYLGN